MADTATTASAAAASAANASTDAPPFQLGKPRFQQTSFFGRFRHFLDIIDPRTLFVTERRLREAVQLLEDYKHGTLRPGVTNEQLWSAQKIKQAILHPDTNEKIFMPFRMSGYIPFGTPIVVGLLLPNQTLASTVFWQWLNQSHNACVNYANRNATKPSPASKFIQGYLGAVISAVSIASPLVSEHLGDTCLPGGRGIAQGVRMVQGVGQGVLMVQGGVAQGVLCGPGHAPSIVLQGALDPYGRPLQQHTLSLFSLSKVGLNVLVQKANKFTPATRLLVQRFVPFPAVASANICNVVLMRYGELEEGIDVLDSDGNLVGSSKIAARHALLETALTRVVLPMPILVLPPIVMSMLEKTALLQARPRLLLPVQSLVCLAAFGLALPLAISLFPQMSEIEKNVVIL
ncbi:hypothetical protein E5288_WYG017339 [Bos mutus]|uniref:Sidoreflexin n=1 Tax=Bos mutus TaxID=72004 RepID=A0A6B0RJJ1_9CETA|nr:hypothetical protein [Bos mutus]